MRARRLNCEAAARPDRPGQPPHADARRRVPEPAADPANAALSDDEVWNLVAWAWLKDVKPEALARGRDALRPRLRGLSRPGWQGEGAGRDEPARHGEDGSRPCPKARADFTDAGTMLAASDVLLQGKILRGGMGTGMPEFGSLYTDEELWAMIAYLRAFLFRK